MRAIAGAIFITGLITTTGWAQTGSFGGGGTFQPGNRGAGGAPKPPVKPLITDVQPPASTTAPATNTAPPTTVGGTRSGGGFAYPATPNANHGLRGNAPPTNSPPATTFAPRGGLAQREPARVANAPAPAAPLNTKELAQSAAASSPVAEQLMSRALVPRGNQTLGQPTSLTQIVERTSGRAQRVKAVQAYWQATAKLAALHGAQDDQGLLARVNDQQMNPHERASLAAAEAAAAAAVHRAELELVTAQHELAEAAQLPTTAALPLPSDAPLVGQYRTQFETLYSGGRAAPAGLRRLASVLPYHLQDVRSRADAVVAAQRIVDSVAPSVGPQTSVAALAETQRVCAEQRTAFLGAVCDYNCTIAEYALAVAPAGESREVVVGMLIKSRAVARAMPVTRSSHEEPADAGETEADVQPQIINRAGVSQFDTERAGAFQGGATQFRSGGVIADEPVEETVKSGVTIGDAQDPNEFALPPAKN